MCGAAQADSVKLRTADGTVVFGELVGEGDKGVVLVHDAERSSGDWDSFAKRLAANGFRVISVDLRGHGASRSALPEIRTEDWLFMHTEIEAAASWLVAQGTPPVAVVGSVLGGNLAARAAADSQNIERIVLLSPSLNVRGVTVATALSEWSGPTLLVADAGNSGAARAASLLAEQGQQVDLDLVEAGAVGHRMLNTVPELEGRLVGWLNGTSTGEGQEDLAKPVRQIDAAQPESIETSGTTFGDPP